MVLFWWRSALANHARAVTYGTANHQPNRHVANNVFFFPRVHHNDTGSHYVEQTTVLDLHCLQYNIGQPRVSFRKWANVPLWAKKNQGSREYLDPLNPLIYDLGTHWPSLGLEVEIGATHQRGNRHSRVHPM